MAAHRRQFRQRLLQQQHRRPRLFKDRSNPLEDLDEDEVFERYRFRPLTILYIVGLLPDLSSATNRNQPLPPLLQVLLCLRYFATGAMHLLVGDSLNISRSSAGRCIRAIARHIANLAGRFIVFPTGVDAASTKRDFSSIAGTYFQIKYVTERYQMI